MDVAVTVPQRLWRDWLDEGDLPDDDTVGCPGCGWRGGKADWLRHDQDCEEAQLSLEWHFCLGGRSRPAIAPGERVYVVAYGRLRGYSPLLRIEPNGPDIRRYGFALVRGGNAVAVTIPETIRGFQGWRYRWWRTEDEVPFPDWQTAGVE